MCPRIFHLYGPLWVNGYGLMIALGFLLFVFLTYCHPMRKKLLSGDEYLKILFTGFLAAIIGGRVLFIAFNLPTKWAEFAEIFYPWVGGFSLFGSIIAVLITVSVCLRNRKVPILPFFDLIGLYAPLLQGVARIGCFFAGCCYGVRATEEVWWAVTFTNPFSLAPIGVSLHPTQLYSAGASFVIFFILQVVSRISGFSVKKRYIPGIFIILYLMLESMARFTVDFWRWDRGPRWGHGPIWGLFSSMQLIVFLLFVVTVIGLFVVVWKTKFYRNIKN